MSDQDFNFNPPPRRDAKKVFEPPPWEKDQFDELARRKEAERIATEALTAAAIPPATVAQPKPIATDQGAPPAEAPAAAGEAVAAESGPVAGQEAGGEDPRIEAMLLGLKNEEPKFGRDIWRVTVASGAVLAAIGSVFVVWGIVAVGVTRQSGIAGSFGGIVLIVFGLVFAAVGAWMAVKALREQGVL